MNEASAPDPEQTAIACSVLMPVLDEERHIEASIAAMARQRFPGRLEFLIVDGGSSDRTREIVGDLARRDPRIVVLENPRRTTPSALNVGLARARGQWVARMDAHTEYPDDYLLHGVRRLEAGGTRWVSGLAVARGRGPVSRAVALALGGPLGRGGSRKWSALQGPDQEYELDSGVFAGVWERATLLEYGGWDERWARNQDSEMAGRFLARGERLILIPAMAAEYSPRDSLRGLARQYFEYGVHRTRTAVRHPHTMRRSHLLAPTVVVTLAASVCPPGRLRRVARGGALVYGTALILAGVRASGTADPRRDAAIVPAALAAMHIGHGAGALYEATRHGLPLAALARVAGLSALARRLADPPEPVYAPSLRLDADSAAEAQDLGDREEDDPQVEA